MFVMTKSKFKKMPRYLMLVSGLIIILTTIGFGLAILPINSEIDNVQLEIDNMTEKVNRLIFNIHMNSDQLVKMSSTYGTYKILNELNSSDKDEFKEHLRNQIYQSIVILRGKGLTSIERDYYNTLTIPELEKEFEKQEKDFENEWVEIQTWKTKLEEKLMQLKDKRDDYSMIFIIIQIIGLFLGILGDFLRG